MPPKPPKFRVPELRVHEFSAKENKDLNEGLEKYVEILLRKKQGQSIKGVYKAPKLSISGVSRKMTSEINGIFQKELQSAVERADVVLIGPIAGAVIASVVGSVLGTVVGEIISNKCDDAIAIRR